MEFWLEDEKYLLTRSCLIYVPRGLRHCPVTVKKVDTPILFLAVSVTSKYVKDNIMPASSWSRVSGVTGRAHRCARRVRG